jgi:hypothetical protein
MAVKSPTVVRARWPENAGRPLCQPCLLKALLKQQYKTTTGLEVEARRYVR